MLQIEDSSENRENWMKLYDRVLYDYKENIQQDLISTHGSKYEGIVRSVTGLRRRPLNPILSILVDAFVLQLYDLQDELDAFKRGMTTTTGLTTVEDKGVMKTNSLLKSQEDDGESTTDDEAAFFRSSSPSLFDLKSLKRSSGKILKAKPKPSFSNIKPSSTSNEKVILSSTQKHVSDKPTSPPRLTHLNLSPIKCPGSPELIVVSSRGNSENLLESNQLKEPLPSNSVKHYPNPPSRGPEVQEDNRRWNESVASLESFDSTLPITDKLKSSKPFQITVRSSNSNETKKKKEPWYDFDRPSKKSQSASKKSNSSNNGSKIMRQMKLDSLTRKKVPEKTVDLSTLKEYKGGAMLSQSGDGGKDQPSSTASLKRKSDESIGSNDKREKLEPLERKSMSQTFFEISPIKLNVACQETNVTPPAVSPRPGPSSTASGANKHETPKKINIPLSPASTSPENVEKQKKADKGKKKPKEIDEISDFTYNLLKDFDKIPSREPPSPNFRYKEPVVRKKSERAKLRGWDCEECREYYEALQSQMDEKEIQRLKDKCSRHRYKYQPVSNTPENFWCTYIPSTEELYADGYIKVGTPVTINPKYIRPKRTSSDSEAENENEES